MNVYITSLRLRTLPLSVSGIILGTGLAFRYLHTGVNLPVFGLAVLTALCLQILSNLCNELGDAQKGTDTDQHERKAYGLQAGVITIVQMKHMIGLFTGLSVLSGSALVLTAVWCSPVFPPEARWLVTGVFLALGALAITGAITYTLGRHSYGYMGLGDLGVFLFFGLLGTLGAFFLQTGRLTPETVWCGAAIGLPCVGVLNLNNIRDMANDRAHGKRTLASLLGERGGRVYHTCLLVVCLVVFAMWGHWWTLCILPVWAWHLWYVWTHDSALDKQMPVLMFSTLAVAVLALF